jgi:hypothetical protein
MTVLGALPVALPLVVRWMCWLAAIATAMNAAEQLVLHRDGRAHRIWHGSSLTTEWGLLGALLNARAFAGLQGVQLLASLLLALYSDTAIAAFSALTLCVTTLLAAMRFRGTVNGGSDGMLFTVLGGLAVAQWPGAPELVREGGVLYVAAVVTLSYVRAGLVKARERAWWTGSALRSFLQLPAYGVPAALPRNRMLLATASVGVITFECLAPLAWWNPTSCLGFMAVAVCFHAGAALVFGLNRFLLAWGAALPALWFAVHRVG